MERGELLDELNGLLSELDAAARGEELEELAAQLEDAIFFLESAEDEEDADEALDEIAGLAGELAEQGAVELATRLSELVTLK